MVNIIYAANEFTNDALPVAIRTGTPGAGLAFYIAQLWKTVVIVGGLGFLVFLIWGGIEWMLAGGDKAKTENATHKITNSLVGLLILVSSFAIVMFIQGVFQINLLKPVFPNNI